MKWVPQISRPGGSSLFLPPNKRKETGSIPDGGTNTFSLYGYYFVP